MWSYRCLAPLAALLALVFACVQGAPPGARDLRDYGAGRNLALQLNEGARYLFREVEVQNTLAVVSDPPLMIRSEDKCDPHSLQENLEPCLSRVALALKNYSRIFGEHGLFQENTECSKWRANANALAAVTRNLLDTLKVILDTLKEPYEAPEPLIIESWMSEGFLCRDSVDRLYSFSIITARVLNFLYHQHR